MQRQTEFWNRIAKKCSAKALKDAAPDKQKLNLTRDHLVPWRTFYQQYHLHRRCEFVVSGADLPRPSYRQSTVDNSV